MLPYFAPLKHVCIGSLFAAYADVCFMVLTSYRILILGQLPPLSWWGKVGCVVLIAAGVFVAIGATVQAVRDALTAAHNHNHTHSYVQNGIK